MGLRILLWPLHTNDLDIAFLPWQATLIEHGRFLALKQPIGDYFPAYYELAALSSLLDPHLARVAQVKLVAFCFDLLSAAAAYALVRRLQADRGPSFENTASRIAAVFVILAGPTVILNSSIFGQQDIDFTFFLLLSVYCVVARKGAWASLFYGLAFAFKLQAIFLAPFFMAMLLRRRIPVWSLALLPLGWILALTPPLLVGASLHTYLVLPFTQMGEIPALAVNIGNPWAVANVIHFPARLGVLLGLVITALVGSAIAALGLRKGAGTTRGMVALAALSLLTMPYVMPKMHDRYFFPAELLMSILACVDLAYLMPVALVLAASLISYAGYFTEYAHHPWTALGLAANTTALYAVIRYALKLTQAAPGEEHTSPELPSSAP